MQCNSSAPLARKPSVWVFELPCKKISPLAFSLLHFGARPHLTLEFGRDFVAPPAASISTLVALKTDWSHTHKTLPLDSYHDLSFLLKK
jgi:hypothetical protein